MRLVSLLSENFIHFMMEDSFLKRGKIASCIFFNFNNWWILKTLSSNYLTLLNFINWLIILIVLHVDNNWNYLSLSWYRLLQFIYVYYVLIDEMKFSHLINMRYIYSSLCSSFFSLASYVISIGTSSPPLVPDAYKSVFSFHRKCNLIDSWNVVKRYINVGIYYTSRWILNGG